MTRTQSIHLLVEQLHGQPRWKGAIVIAADANTAHVALGENGAPQLATNGEHALLSVQSLQGPVPRLAVTAHCDHVLINGQPSPPVAVLRGGDEIDIAHDWRLHLSLYRCEPVVLTGGELVGRECPVCLSRFQPNMRAYVCACGVAMHIAGVTTADEIDCASAAGECPNCRRSIDLHAGYESLPREYDAAPVL